MRFNSFIDRLNEILAQEDLITSGKDASMLKVEFEDYLLEAERLDQVAVLTAREEGKSVEGLDFKPMKDEFYKLYKVYSEKRKKQLELKTAFETENLRLKKELIGRLKEVIQNEEKIGAAFNLHKEIHETWKKIGDIPRDKRVEIQKEYSRLLELFFYNIKIFKELKDHDVRRNLQLKEDLIFKLKNLRNSNLSFREIEEALKMIQDEWEEIGPVPNEDWEELKKSYWDVVRGIFEKINLHYEEQRNILADNISRKKQLIDSLENILARNAEINSLKEWDNATQNVISVQEEWKRIGFGTKKENEEVWKIFRSKCDLFFEAKKQYVSKVEEMFKMNAESKRKLIDEVNAIKHSKDWKETTEKIILIQKKWKNIGSAGSKFENKLWSAFRAGCDEFFSEKEKYFQQQDLDYTENLTAKNNLIESLANTSLSENKQEAIQQLKDFSNRFSEIGHVPKNQADSTYKKFKALLDKKYTEIKLDENEREKIQFQSKIDTMLLSPEKGRLLMRERSELKKQIEQLTREIALLENNLGFFSKSKGADKLRGEVEKKVRYAQQKIDTLKKKISMLPNE